MFAVERLGSYITRGVNTVSGPFHPFGGAVDIVVVEQQDGSFKSSPWYIRFGKFQGVLKAKEKVVNISVDGIEANFHMYLDHRGVAYFRREVDVEEVDTILLPLSSGEEADSQYPNRKPVKSKSCNYDANQSDLVTQIDLSNRKVVARTSSRRSQILGLVFGRRSIKEDGAGVVRADLLERAEIAADLLDVKWSTNLASGRYRKDNASCFPASDILDSEEKEGLHIDDGKTKVESLVPNNIMNGLYNDSLPPIEAIDLEFFLGTSPLDESSFEGANELNTEKSRKIDELDVANACHDENAEGVISDISSPRATQIIDFAKLEPCPSEKLGEEHVFVFDEKDGGFPDSGVSKEENGADRVQSFLYCETPESSRIGMDDFGEQANKTMYDTTELVSELNSQLETGLLVAEEPLNCQEVLQDENCCVFFNDANVLENEITSINTNSIVPETYFETVTVHPANDSAKEVESSSVFTISSFSNSNHQAQDEKSTREEGKMNKLRPPLEPVGGDDFVPTQAINVIPLEGSGEEQFLFSDLDDLKLSEVKSMESIFVDHLEEENRSTKGSETLNEPLLSNFESVSSPDKFVGEKMPCDVEELRQKSKIKSIHIDVPRSSKVAGQEVGRMVESLPNMWSHSDELDTHHLHRSLGLSLDSNSKSPKWMLLREDVSSCIKSAADDEHQLSNSRPIIKDVQMSTELKIAPASPTVGDPSEITEARGGSWGIWRFPKSRSMKGAPPTLNCTRSFDSENALESIIGMDGEKDVSKRKVNKKIIRAITPTSEQLASLNLKEGRNTVTFTFSTAMLGKQQVDARIYLWRWDTRIVISDVDGTITKSDLLGQFMPLVGRDWSQTGVAHLFSAIKENDYQLLFLSARAISQAYLTRQFLFNLKQDGKALPDGPVVISPDGLFPSLFREVIRRAPHEFKIACLENIKALFPSDRNPFYAGFGNRNTDEFSYLKVGIPKGKIFIINPKGEVVVNRRVDTKSYTSLHALVNGMFPPMSSSEQEDFNSWNYWKLPPPAIDI